MLDASGTRFRLLTRVGDLASANITAARLRAEGIEARVHSPSLGPYPVTVGEFATSEIWVLEDRLEEASEILLDVETKNVVGFDADFTPAERPRMRADVRLIAAVVAIVLATLFVLRIVRVIL